MSPTNAQAKSKLTITHGVQPQFTIDADSAEQLTGSAEDVLSRLIREHGSPAMQDLLREPNVSLEVFGQDAQGEVTEKPVSLSADWHDVVDMLKHADVELGLAKTHVGGQNPGQSLFGSTLLYKTLFACGQDLCWTWPGADCRAQARRGCCTAPARRPNSHMEFSPPAARQA